MTITVGFFASLRESTGRRGIAVDDARVETAGDAWRLATGGPPIPGDVFAVVNPEYTYLGAPVRGGDEVAFFPPVTGGRAAVPETS